MSYIITKADGTQLITPLMPNGVLLDGTTDSSTGVTLIGRNASSYGELQNENFVKLMQNFANSSFPGQIPLEGTLWWDTVNKRLNIYNGTKFASVSPIVDSATAPTANNLGDLWWDTANQQLRAWNGSSWLLVGPSYTASQGVTGSVVETLYDNTQAPHTVVVEYVNGTAVSIFSYDSFALGATTHGFNYIYTGLNSIGDAVFSNAVQANLIVGKQFTVNSQLTLSALDTSGNAIPGPAVVPGATSVYDIGTNTTKFRNIYLSGNVSLPGISLQNATGSLTFTNSNLNGSVNFYVNASGANTRGVYIDGATGLLYVAADPTGTMGVATKNYVDNSISGLNTTLQSEIGSTNANVAALAISLNVDFANTLASLANDTSVINSNYSTLSAELTALQNLVTADETTNASNFGRLNSSITGINTTIAGLAPINSPVFTGTPTAPTPSSADNSTLLATTAFVQTKTAALSTDYNTKINNLATVVGVNLTNGLGPKAPIISPNFLGTPTAPTPNPGDNSTAIATTSFVTAAIAAQKFTYTVSSNPPAGGNNGDFWFQIG